MDLVINQKGEEENICEIFSSRQIGMDKQEFLQLTPIQFAQRFDDYDDGLLTFINTTEKQVQTINLTQWKNKSRLLTKAVDQYFHESMVY